MFVRVGIGHDTHRLTEGGPLRLGGIIIPHDQQLVGHSDADVLLHAITDAILGAAGLGDIGELFPDSADENRDRDSCEMLSIAAAHVADAGYTIQNIDCIVFAQRPKITPYKDQIRDCLCEVLRIQQHQVNVKAKTGERVGPVGRQEAMMAQCVALISRDS